MAWAVGNARVEPKGNAITITKQASGSGEDRPADGGVQCGRADGDEPEGERKVIPWVE